MMKLTLLAILTVAATTLAFQIKPGKCPDIKEHENFDIEKWLGVWYIIQGSRTGEEIAVEDCVTLNFTKAEGESYASTQLPQNWTTKLRFRQLSTPSDLLIKLEGDHESPFHVVVTDYDNYGCFIICENLEDDKFRRAAAILSRVPRLDIEKIEMMRAILAKYDLFEEDMTEVMTCDA